MQCRYECSQNDYYVQLMCQTRVRDDRASDLKDSIQSKSERTYTCIINGASERAKISRFQHTALHVCGCICSTMRMQPLNRGNEKKREPGGEKKTETKRTSASGWRARFRESWTSAQGIEGSAASWYIYIQGVP